MLAGLDVQIAFLNLCPTEEELEAIGSSRNLMQHCKSVMEVKQDSILDIFVRYLDETDYEEQ